ncbi:hypothetical protein SD80_032940 [Scytonema tolypothrichoides VB-61278]|nr:hypothetical protein SD80_032940 [Scytonema tolypothrichoides VB-61278]
MTEENVAKVADGQSPQSESLLSTLEKMPPAIADGFTVPFCSQLQTPNGKVILLQSLDARCRVVVKEDVPKD